jgi:opacity protein-like surface antigen
MALCFATSALAVVPIPFGWYLEGNAGQSRESNKSYPGSVKNTGFGWNVDGGYKFTPFVGVEVGYTSYAQTRIQNSLGATAANDSHYSYDLAGKLMLPLAASGVEIFAKLGVARLNSYVTVINANAAAVNNMVFNTGTHTATGFYYGGGVDYSFLPNVLVNAQWARAQGSNSTGNLDLLSLGLSYIA